MIIPKILFIALVLQGSHPEDPRSVVEKASQASPIHDFECEFEGKITSFDDEGGPDGRLLESFGGRFRWTAQGNVLLDVYRQSEENGEVTREQMRVYDGEVQQYVRREDMPVGEAVVQDAAVISIMRSASPGMLLLMDELKKTTSFSGMTVRGQDEYVDEKWLYAVSIGQEGAGTLWKTWLNLSKGGQGVRHESYLGEGNLSGRTLVEVERFEVEGKEAWLPVSGTTEVFSRIEDGKLVFQDTPVRRESVYIIRGTLKFNQNPSPRLFTLEYEPGAPISDNIKKMRYAHGQQKPEKSLSVSEMEQVLETQLAEMENSGKEVLATPGGGIPWLTVLTWVFGLGSLVTVAILLRRR